MEATFKFLAFAFSYVFMVLYSYNIYALLRYATVVETSLSPDSEYE